MKYGFALIELIIATLIASMVAGILLAALSQGNRFQMIIDNTIDLSSRIGVVSNQLEKDLMGAFIPVQAESSSAKAPEDKQKEESDEAKKSDNKKIPDKKDEVEQKSTDKKEEKPIEKIFYSINKNGKLDILTFITNNPLVVYVGKDVGVVKSKVVRVQYSLRPEVGKKDSYALFRQESMELNIEKYKDVREYEVIGGIKNCTITFTARIQKKDEKAEQSKEKPKISYEYKTLNEWVSEQKKDADTQKQEFPRIPYSVEIVLVLWDMQDKREQKYIIVCQIPIDFTEPKKEEKKKAEQPKKDEEQSAPADKGKGNQQKTAQNKQSSGQETVVYNGIETTAVNLDSLKRIFGHV
jgi:type II secretory pathway component PulJ